MNFIKPTQRGLVTFMKISLMQLFLAVLCTVLAQAHHSVGQELLEQRISVMARNESLKTVLHKIEKAASVTFSYKAELLKPYGNVTIHQTSLPLNEVLDLLFNHRMTYEVINKQIIIREITRSDVGSEPSYSSLQVSGVVTDEANQSMPGVNIIVKGTTLGTTSDVDGKFTLDVPDQNAILVFSFIGFLTQEIQVGEKTGFNVVLKADVQSLSEVVVVGYGTNKKIDLTGAVASVRMQDVELQPNVNLMQSMRGSIAGVNVTDNGRAGSDGSITIRGLSSISGSNAPLIVLDNIPYYGGLSDINTNDIESIHILKDGSSAAIYGSRAANGVILITTKKGKSERPKLNYNGYYGFSDFAYVPKTLGPDKYLQLKQDASAFTGRDLTVLNPLEEESLAAGKSIDPWEAVKQDAPMQSHELSISGQTKAISYFVSGSYVDQKSPLYGDQFSRLSARVNLDVTITDWLTIGTNTGYSIKDYSGEEADISMVPFISPFAQFFDENGDIIRLVQNDGLVTNPIFGAYVNDNYDVRNNLFSNVYALIKLPLPGLTYKIQNGNTVLRNEGYFYSPSFNREGFNTLGSGSKNHGRANNLVLENILRYDKEIMEGHTIDVTLLYGIEKNTSGSSRLASNNIYNDALSYNGLYLGENPSVSTSATESKAISSMARIGYRFQEKYMLNFTARRDGFSAFGENNKFGVFPSVGASWVVSNEPFMKSLRPVDLLKLRFSYGKNGNRGVNPYQSLISVAPVQYVFGDGNAPVNGLNPTSLSNPSLGWETTLSANIGLDFGFLESRIHGSLDVYNTDTRDLLLNRRIPNVNGYENFFGNFGKLNNKGVELTLNTVNIEKNELQWISTFVFTANRNRIVELIGKEDDIASSRFIGEPLFSHFNYVFDGIWQEGDDFAVDPNAKPGYIRFKDISGPDGVPDGKITAADRQVLGTSQPDFTWAITNNISYKGLTLSFLVNGQRGAISPNPVLNPGTNFYDRVNILDVAYWTPENPRNDVPSVGYPNPYNYGFYQSRDFVRLQDVTVAYALPSSIISKLGLSQVRLYLSGKNLKTWTDWTGFDPEHGQMGTFDPSLAGPLIKSYVFGLNVSL